MKWSSNSKQATTESTVHFFFATYTLIVFAIFPVVERVTHILLVPCVHIHLFTFSCCCFRVSLYLYVVVVNSFVFNGCSKLFPTVIMWFYGQRLVCRINFRFDRNVIIAQFPHIFFVINFKCVVHFKQFSAIIVTFVRAFGIYLLFTQLNGFDAIGFIYSIRMKKILVFLSLWLAKWHKSAAFTHMHRKFLPLRKFSLFHVLTLSASEFKFRFSVFLLRLCGCRPLLFIYKQSIWIHNNKTAAKSVTIVLLILGYVQK